MLIYILLIQAYEEIGSGYANVDLNTKKNDASYEYIKYNLQIPCAVVQC